MIFDVDFLLFSEKNDSYWDHWHTVFNLFWWLGKLKKTLLPVIDKVNPMASELEIQIQEIIPQVAKNIAQMDVTNPEILRVTRAFLHFNILPKPCVWDVMAISIRRVSRVKRFRRFGAISWHGGYWKKILTLLTLYNGPAALFCGFLTAILMAILFCFGILPGIDRGYFGIPFSPWCLPSGFVVSIVVMISWRSPTKVFLDRICY